MINLSNRCLEVPYVLCPNCGNEVESRNHLFFGYSMALDLFRLLGRWWNIDIYNLIDPFSWESWFNGLWLNSLQKLALEAAFFIMWWQSKMSSSSSDENKKMKSMIGDDDEIKATRKKLMLDFHKDVEASFGDKLRSVTYLGSLQMRRVADDKACQCRQLVTSGIRLSPILGNHGSQNTGSAGNIGGGSSIGRSKSSREALCKVRGEIDVEFRDEENVVDPHKVVVLVG
nr:RNA-directed DNA polymerase, eukaryota, reverse transcriptase zinc-binding domain protein [Tanacetum cinerariifolium]